MKKTLLIGLALTAALSISAQTSVVKEVQRNLKSSSPNAAQALKDIQPALTNPETKGDAETWVIAGNAGFSLFQDVILKQATGQNLDANQKKEGANAIYDAFTYYLTALPLDSVPDAKGKVKPKFSKAIVKKIGEQYEQLPNGAAYAWEAQDYNKAYDLFEMYLTLPNNPVLGPNAPKAPADSIQGQMLWNQAVAMLLLNKSAEALAKMRQMDGKGYTPDEYYEYAVAAAQQAGDNDAASEFARKGIEKYGAGNTTFIAVLINDQLNKKDFTSAYKLANDALAAAPADNGELRSQLYDILGTIAENEEKDVEAEQQFRSAVEADPSYAKGWYDLGRIIHNRAIKVDNSIDTEQQRVEQVYPLERQAAEYFEKAYNLDKEMTNIPGILYRIYYMLGDEDKAKYWENE